MDELKIVERAKNGDNDAFRELEERYKGYIKLISRRYFLIGGEQEDIYQEGLVGLNNAVKGFKIDKNTSFKTFAIRCINSAIKTSITKSNTQSNKALNDSISVDSEMEDEDAWAVVLISDELSPEQELIKRQQLKYVLSEMDKKLTDLQKQVLNLYLKNKSYIEIAQIIGKENNTKFVDNTLMQIKKKLAYLKEQIDL